MTEVSTALITGGAALLSACIALGGVYVGQLLQGKREQKNLVEQWKREDRTRFADHKRDLYANCLGILAKWIQEVDDLAFVADIELHRLIDDGQDPPDNLAEWLDENDHKDPTRYIDRCHALLQQVRLVAPENIYHAVWGVIGSAMRASEFLVFNGKPTNAYDRAQRARKDLDKVADLMTKDLATAIDYG